MKKLIPKIYITTEVSRHYPVIVIFKKNIYCCWDGDEDDGQFRIMFFKDEFYYSIKFNYKEVGIEGVPEEFRESVRNKIDDPFLEIDLGKLLNENQ